MLLVFDDGWKPAEETFGGFWWSFAIFCVLVFGCIDDLVVGPKNLEGDDSEEGKSEESNDGDAHLFQVGTTVGVELLDEGRGNNLALSSADQGWKGQRLRHDDWKMTASRETRA